MRRHGFFLVLRPCPCRARSGRFASSRTASRLRREAEAGRLAAARASRRPARARPSKICVQHEHRDVVVLDQRAVRQPGVQVHVVVRPRAAVRDGDVEGRRHPGDARHCVNPPLIVTLGCTTSTACGDEHVAEAEGESLVLPGRRAGCASCRRRSAIRRTSFCVTGSSKKATSYVLDACARARARGRRRGCSSRRRRSARRGRPPRAPRARARRPR